MRWITTVLLAGAVAVAGCANGQGILGSGEAGAKPPGRFVEDLYAAAPPIPHDHDWEADRLIQASLENDRIGEARTGVSGDGRFRYRVEPLRTRKVGVDRYCRVFRFTLVARGDNDVARGRACRNPDGTWHPAPGNLNSPRRVAK